MATDRASRLLDGHLLRRLLVAAATLLARRARRIDHLNVFPVPDGDTGTNLLLTLRAALASLEAEPAGDVGAAAAIVARGALMGARGNSGVILSQYFRGLARGLDAHAGADGAVLADALRAASDAATAAVSRPVEGTILTVARDVARAAAACAGAGADLADVLDAAAAEAGRSVERTPALLPILRDAGVVDAGGFGLATMLEGMSLALNNAPLPDADEADPEPAALRLPPETYGYCTEFLVRGGDLDLPRLRARLGELGDSLLVVGDDRLIRVHLHTFQPGRAIDLALQDGEVDAVKIENMHAQNRRLHASSEVAASSLIAVASGAGFAELYRSLGAGGIVSGGTTFNPSAEEIARAVRAAGADGTVVLPNHPNVFLAARQAADLVGRPLMIVPSKNMAEGVAAALAFNPSRDPATNTAAMERAMAMVRTGEITTAARAARLNGRAIDAGAVLGLIDGRIEVVGSSLPDVVVQALARLDAGRAEVITLYVGAKVPPGAAELVLARVRQEYPNQQVDAIPGGQPHYPYILACE